MKDDNSKIADYLAKGGKVTKCDPGPSENVVYRNGPRFRRSVKSAPVPGNPASSDPNSAPGPTPDPASGSETVSLAKED